MSAAPIFEALDEHDGIVCELGDRVATFSFLRAWARGVAFTSGDATDPEILHALEHFGIIGLFGLLPIDRLCVDELAAVARVRDL